MDLQDLACSRWKHHGIQGKIRSTRLLTERSLMSSCLTEEEDDDDGIQANIILLHSKSTSMRHDDNVPLIIKMLKLFLGCDLGKPEDREMT